MTSVAFLETFSICMCCVRLVGFIGWSLTVLSCLVP